MTRPIWVWFTCCAIIVFSWSRGTKALLISYAVIFGALWSWSYIQLTLEDRRKLKYRQTLSNIRRLEKWHEQNP